MTSIRIHLLGREYALRVEDGHDEATRRYAAALDERLRTFRTQFPSQLELTASMIVANQTYRSQPLCWRAGRRRDVHISSANGCYPEPAARGGINQSEPALSVARSGPSDRDDPARVEDAGRAGGESHGVVEILDGLRGGVGG